MSDKTQTYEIAEYNGVAAALDAITTRYKGRVYDVTTKAGMEDARVARREIRTTRTGLEKLRKELKEPALRRCQLIDSEAKRITGELLKIEQPIDEVIAAEELRVEREKQERLRAEALRVAGIKERIEAFNIAPPWGSSATAIMALLRAVSDIAIDETFAEFADAAAIVKAQAMARLTTMHAEAKAIEDEQEKLRVLQAETEARLKAEREAHDKAMEQERQERIAAQRKLDEQAAEERNRLAEEARIAREGQQLAEQAREQEALLAAKQAAEQAERAARDLAIEQAKAHSSEEALQRVADVVDKWTSDQIDAEAAMDEIELIVAANA
jgi:hypothetical protein